MRAAIAIVLVVPGAVFGQDATVIPDEPFCDCEIVFEHVVTLGTVDGIGALPGEVRQVGRDSRGIYYVLAWQDHRILRFDADGTPLEPIDRQGEGPGEFRDVAYFTFIADSLFLWDRRNARLTVLEPGGVLARTVAAPGLITDAERLPDGKLFVNGRLTRDADGATPPLHIIEEGQPPTRSFGEPAPAPVNPRVVSRLIAWDGEHIWASHRVSYRLRAWSTTGELIREYEREAPWMRPWTGRNWSREEPISSQIVDLVIDPGGNIRTIALNAAPDWAERLPPPERPGGLSPIPPGEGLIQPTVEIIDPRAGRLIARGTFEREFYGFVDAHHVFSYQEDEIGIPTVSIWRLELAQKTGVG